MNLSSFDWRKEVSELIVKKNIKDKDMINRLLLIFEGYYECIKGKNWGKETLVYTLNLKDYCDCL